MVKNKKKKKVSKESLGNNTAGTSSGNNPTKPKKKKSKKKTSKEELLDPILASADPSNRSELNLLAALENPIVPGGGNVSDDSTTQQEEQVEKPNKVIKIITIEYYFSQLFSIIANLYVLSIPSNLAYITRYIVQILLC